MEKRIFYFNITYRCNERCVFCAADTQSDSKEAVFLRERDLSLEEFAGTLRSLAVCEKDEIWISGGEPSVHPEFLEIVEASCRRGASVWVSTTATFFTKRSSLKRLNAGHQCSFDIRLYGPGPKEHDKLTRIPGSFDRTVTGIRNLLKTRGERQLLYQVGVRLLLARQTIPHLVDTALYAMHDLGIDSVCVIMLIESRSTHRSSAFFSMGSAKREIKRLFRAVDGDRRVDFSGLPLCILPGKLAKKELRRSGVRSSTGTRPSGEIFYYFDPLTGSVPKRFQSQREEFGNDLRIQDGCSGCEAIGCCAGLPTWYWSVYGGKETLLLRGIQ